MSKRNFGNQFVPGTKITENGLKMFKCTIFRTKFSKTIHCAEAHSKISRNFSSIFRRAEAQVKNTRKFSKNTLPLFGLSAYFMIGMQVWVSWTLDWCPTLDQPISQISSLALSTIGLIVSEDIELSQRVEFLENLLKKVSNHPEAKVKIMAKVCTKRCDVQSSYSWW